MRETHIEIYCYVKHKNAETDGYQRDKSLKSEKLKSSEITITETRKKTLSTT